MNGFQRHPDTRAAVLGGFPLSEVFHHDESGGPIYAYDLDGIEATARALLDAAGENAIVAYAVKANSAGSILRRLAAAGTGADVVSGGELELARRVGIPPHRIVMSGVAKSDAEIDLAVASGIRALQVESIEELARVEARARGLGKAARVSARINPGVNIDSHAHIATGHDAAKFGIRREAWPDVRAIAGRSRWLELVGVSVHVGSMLRHVEPYLASGGVVCDLAQSWLASGAALEFVDFGGGYGIDYGSGDVPPPPQVFAAAARELLQARGLGALQLIVEPGRCVVGPFGALVARVIQTKVTSSDRWVMLNAGMNDMIRTALYGAHHRIEPLERPPAPGAWRVVGPVCESSDDFGRHELGPEPPAAVAIRDVGAYGFAQASEYNGRALPTELFVSGGSVASVNPSPGVLDWVERRLRA